MKVLFLDFDGVVNKYMWQPVDDKMQVKYNREYDGILNDEQALYWVNDLCLKYNLSIVVTSTWRRFYSNTEELATILYRSGLNEDILVSGKTDVLNLTPGEEIAYYLFTHPDITEFVIIDDSLKMFSLDDYLVHCNSFHGFGITEYQQAVTILERQGLTPSSRGFSIRRIKNK